MSRVLPVNLFDKHLHESPIPILEGESLDVFLPRREF
jgi:hypothetical protein